MKLSDILKDTYAGNLPDGFADKEISNITSDSRKANSSSLFAALKGPANDGAKFIPQVIEQGVPVIIKQGEDTEPTAEKQTLVLTMPNTHAVLEKLLRIFYGDVSKKIKVIGITGTNGKTTITYLLESLLNNADLPCGVVGTINCRYSGKSFESKNTTPGMAENHELLSEMVRASCKYCAMETSSHALDQCRTGGIDFAGAIFTNLTSDHLDYHKTREDYFLAKAKLFTALSLNTPAVINIDDEFAGQLIEMSGGRVLTYGIKNRADFFAKDIKLGQTGTEFTLVAPSGEIAINTPLIGLHNVYNILAAVGIAHEEGLTLGQIKDGIEKLKNIPGRLESISEPLDNARGEHGFSVFVDYAHTEDALINVLNILKEVCKGKIITVFGCGGDRDKTKRPKMGKVATEMSNFAIVTSDNPRSEDPQTIANEVAAGANKDNYKIILDRGEAIREALKMAQPSDCVLLAGKGHETYQVFKNESVHFDDREEARKCLLKNI